MKSTSMAIRIPSFIFATLIVAACSTPPQAKVDKFRLCFASSAAMNFLPRYATRSGIFRENGLEVEEIFVKGNPPAVAMLTSGEADACTLGADSVVAATTAGADIVFIASFLNRNQGFLVAAPDVRQPQDLIGRKIAGQRPGSPVDRLLRLYLAEYGVAEDQVEFLDMGTTTQAERLGAVLSGNASATFVSTVMDAHLAEKKGLVVLVGPDEVSAPDRMGGAYAARRERIAASRDMYLRFVRALKTAAVRAKTDAEGMQAALAEYAKLDAQKDAALLQVGFEKMVGRYMDDAAYPSTQALQLEIELLSKTVEGAAAKKPADFMDTTLLEDAPAK